MQDHKPPKILNSHSFNLIRNNNDDPRVPMPPDQHPQDLNSNEHDDMRNTWKREQPKINSNKLPSAFTQSNAKK